MNVRLENVANAFWSCTGSFMIMFATILVGKTIDLNHHELAAYSPILIPTIATIYKAGYDMITYANKGKSLWEVLR